MRWLNDRFFQGFWPILGILAILSTLTLVFIGQVNDWMRMSVYLIVLGIAWLLSKGPYMRIAVFGVFVASFLLVLWMALDPQSLLNRLNLGVLGYGTLIAQVTLGVALHFGWFGAAFATVTGLMFLLPYSRDGVWAFAAFLNTAAAALGAAMNALLLQLQGAKIEIERVAMLDELTGLENRRAMLLTLRRYQALASRQGSPLLVTSWDLNDLKRINDRDGHAAGDAHLRNFAQMLRSEARLEDAFFRIGGDEFVGLHLGLSDGAELLDRVRSRFAGVAAGWAFVDQDFEAALIKADRLLYANKAQMKAHTGPLEATQTGL
jgi:GGDEF domain-containing protein